MLRDTCSNVPCAHHKLIADFWSLISGHHVLCAGANAILAVSLAVAKAGAAEKGVPLYKHIADLAGNTKLVHAAPPWALSH
jgi:hypothetical protein